MLSHKATGFASVSSSTPTSAIIYDAYTSLIKKIKKVHVRRFKFVFIIKKCLCSSQFYARPVFFLKKEKVALSAVVLLPLIQSQLSLNSKNAFTSLIVVIQLTKSCQSKN